MSFIDNIKNDIEEASARYDLMTDKIMLFESVAYNNYIIKQKEAYLDAYKYGGDYTDYITESENGSSFAERTKATIDKIIESIKEFFEKIKEKITEIFEKLRSTKLIQNVENLIKSNPKAASVKVDFEDNDKHINFLQDKLEKCKQRLSRMISNKGSASEKDKNENENDDNAVTKYIAIGTGIVIVTVAAGVIINNIRSKGKDVDTTADTKLFESARKLVDDIGKRMNTKKNEKLVKKIGREGLIDKLRGNDDTRDLYLTDKTTEELADMYRNITKEIGLCAKIQQALAKAKVTRLSNLVSSLTSIGSEISNSVSNVNNKLRGNNKVSQPKVDGETITASAHEDSFDADDYFSELCNDIFGEDTSTEDDFDTMYSELCNDIFF